MDYIRELLMKSYLTANLQPRGILILNIVYFEKKNNAVKQYF